MTTRDLRVAPAVGRSRAVEAKKRPKDRKAQIAAAAAIAFSERGYHGVSVEDIASSVGISPSALYRHFPKKYALFQYSALSLMEALTEALDAVDSSGQDADRLPRDLLAVIRTTISNRRTAGIYRWESRFLEPSDKAVIREHSILINRRVGAHLSPSDTPVSERDARLVVAAMFSAIGSITAHNLVLPQKTIERILLSACVAIDQARFARGRQDNPQSRRSVLAPLGDNKRERLLHEAVRLFDSHGYHDVKIEEIAAAAGLNASGMYRYFPSKADLLSAIFYRAADRLDVATVSVLDASDSPAEALASLSLMYVDLSFAQHELMSIYFSEMRNLLPSHRNDLKSRQKLYVVEWARLLREIRPELTEPESMFVVHAALNVVPDVGRLLGFDPGPENVWKVHCLVSAVLFGGPAQR
ncbi:TetR/AcrR family transcriptional regulator [Rhodococcus sp. MS16]|uniref:TetR family transcriptional regulator n=1 Tax=Rhodococcus sp. MS16 TaxID=2579941 RepID=UPI001562D61E|nr:TetR/AcrR family transcriptional regulator [Rhodococcus sp. MS16]